MSAERELPPPRSLPKRPARHDSDARKRQKVNEPIKEQPQPLPVSDLAGDAVGSGRIAPEGLIGNSEACLATIRGMIAPADIPALQRKTHHDLDLMASEGACQMLEAFATMKFRLENIEKQLKECQEALSKSEEKASDLELKFTQSERQRAYDVLKARVDANAREKLLKECQEDLCKSRKKASAFELKCNEYERILNNNKHAIASSESEIATNHDITALECIRNHLLSKDF